MQHCIPNIVTEAVSILAAASCIKINLFVKRMVVFMKWKGCYVTGALYYCFYDPGMLLAVCVSYMFLCVIQSMFFIVAYVFCNLFS